MNLSEIKIEYRFSAVFAALSFVFSLAIGLIAGIDVSVVVVRTIFSVVIFGLLGYAAAFVLSKYVPEVLSLIRSSDSEEIDILPESGLGGAADSETADESTGAFSEMDESSLPRVERSTNQGFEDSLNDDLGSFSSRSGVDPAGGKLGKHIISEDKKFKYEPKLMAQAVRTMMRKDVD